MFKIGKNVIKNHRSTKIKFENILIKFNWFTVLGNVFFYHHPAWSDFIKI